MRATASWSRPDLIFDNHVHGSGTHGALLGEVADEGWTVVASPLSDTPPDSLQPNDLIIQRAIGDGRLAFVHAMRDVDPRSLYGARGLLRGDVLVLRKDAGDNGFKTTVDLGTFVGDESSEDQPAPAAGDSGETIVHLPLLTAHAAPEFSYNLSRPNCVLRWARVPRGFAGDLDVVVHFHGFKGHNAMRIAAKAKASGLDLQSPGVAGPTLGLVPHGRAFVSDIPDTDGFTFPAIASREKLQRFIDASMTAFKSAIGSTDRTLTIKRVILTGHSGGGAALNLLMRSIGSGDAVRAFHYFDATYGGAAVLTDREGWLRSALQRDARLLQSVATDAERSRVMRDRGGSLRIVFIDGTKTAPTARAVDQFIDTTLREIVSDEGLRTFLRRYYRAQSVANPKTVGHSLVPKTFGGRLLADAGDALAGDARDLVVPRPPAEDTPTASDTSPLDRVRSAIDTTLQSFRNIVVSAPAPVGRDVSVHVPYFINKATSPSRVRAEQRRPNLLRNDTLARLYNGLHFRARIGKAYPADIRAFLQGAIDANAVPGQSSGLSAGGLKSFLSDMGVGVDCSGFVSQALNACMTSFGRTERIDTNSANLRGGAGHNQQQFDLVTRPRDLTPGDTMWKTGHIRIIHKVEPQADGSIQFVTAESSSVDLVGAVAKVWKCPHADRFASISVERSGSFQPSTEVNVFSRYRPLAEVLRPQPPSEAEDEPTVTAAPPASTALTQSDIDRIALVEFANTADIDTFFSRSGSTGFAGWFNTELSGRLPFGGGRTRTLRMGTATLVRQHFVSFWNSIALAYDRPRITALDFAALMCIVLNETGGDFAANPESCRGASDARGRHAGLAYAFDRIIDHKASYNTLAGNRRAGELFNDEAYIRAHGSLGGATRLANHGSEFGNAWNSTLYPQSEFSTVENLDENGFIMQADFYKFRGRGVIQTTGRPQYLTVINHIQRYTGTNTVITDFKGRWSGVTAAVAATTSTNADWDLIFSQGPILARAIRLHSGTGEADYRRMATQSTTLLDVPPPPTKGVPTGVRGSIYFMGRRISGKYGYSAGLYRDRVLAMLSAMRAL